MPNPKLSKEFAFLETTIIETLLAGLKAYRPDLRYPQSHSDMQACVRGLLRMFEVTRLPLFKELKYEKLVEDFSQCKESDLEC